MKALFLTRHIREKLLVLAIFLAGVGYWGTTLFGRAATELATTKKLNSDLKDQQDWLARKDQVEAHLKDQVSQLDPKKAASVGGITVAIERILTDLNIDLTALQTPQAPTQVRSTLMTVSTEKITLNNLNMQDMLDIYRALSALAPFVDIESVTLSVSQAGGGRGGRGGRAGGGPNGANFGNGPNAPANFGGGNAQAGGGRRGNRGGGAAGPGIPTLGLNQPPPAQGSRLNAVFTLQGVSLNSARNARPARQPAAVVNPAG